MQETRAYLVEQNGLGSETGLEAKAKFHPLGGAADVRNNFENDSLSI